MNARKRLMRMYRQKKEKYPLPPGKSEFFNYRGEMRRYNPETGKYDIKA